MKTNEEDRKTILLRATYDILKQCNDSYYVLSPFEVTAIWDDAVCDGYCLFDEIAEELGVET